MAITHGDRIGLTRWSDDDDEWDRADFDADNARLEQGVAIDGQGPLGGMPPPGIAGRYFWALDIRQLFRDNGISWNQIGHASRSGTVPFPSGVSGVDVLFEEPFPAFFVPRVSLGARWPEAPGADLAALMVGGLTMMTAAVTETGFHLAVRTAAGPRPTFYVDYTAEVNQSDAWIM